MNEKELENLKKIYLAARSRLLDKIINTGGAGTKTYCNTILKQLEKELARLQTATNTYIDTSIPAEYQKGLNEVYNYFKRNNLMVKRPDMFAQIHTDAVYALARELQYQISEGLAQAGRQILRYLDESRDEALRRIGLEAAAEKITSGSTVLDMKNNMIEKLQSEGFMTVQYGQGKNAYQVSLDAYAMMCARSTTREAGNLARENQLIENGYDLVEMTTHYPTCEICAQFQGRVYSISGKDKRFPPLSKAFASGYRNVHPNCRHSIIPWVESLKTPQEIERAVEESNRPFKDVRQQKEIDLYNKQQAQNRQMRQDLYQYERYKARLGGDAPKSFHAFRKLKKAGGEKWEDLQYYYKYKGDRPTYCVKIDRELDKLGINKGKAYPADNNFEVKSWRPHAVNRLNAAGISKDEALRWKEEAKIMLKRFPPPQTQLNYYFKDGIIGVRESDGIALTVIEKARFLPETKTILEVISKYV